MKKCSIILLVLAFALASCSAGRSASVPTETLTATQTKGSTPTASATSTSISTATSSPTPSVAYKLVGLDFGPYTKTGQNPDFGTEIPQEQLQEQIELIAPYTGWIRTYGCTGFEQVVPIAHDLGVKVALGAWLGKDESANDKEISCLVKAAVKYQPDMLIVGSEALYRGDLSASQLIGYLQTVKKVLPEFTVATADTAASWLAHKDLIEASDVVMANIYPYWEGKDVTKAIAWLNAAYENLQYAAGEKEVWVSETGWPDAGNTVKQAVPSAENAAAYFLNFISWAKAKNVNYFYFEAFDEPWKATDEHPQEAHWGIWSNTYEMKAGMDQVFLGNSVPDNWTPTATPVPTRVAATAAAVTAQPTANAPQGSASIYISLPGGSTWPSNGILQGYVKNVDVTQYSVAVYIQVDGGWWTKPYFDYPLTYISANGYWETTYITGGNDASASAIVAVLLPNSVKVQLADGGDLPDIGGYQSARISR